MDGLTTGNRVLDQARYVNETPQVGLTLTFLKQALLRLLDTEGRAVTIRILRAVHAAFTDLAPAADAPMAQHAIYGHIRSMVLDSLHRTLKQTGTGVHCPVLSNAASDALALIEAQDPLISEPEDRPANLTYLLGGITWREVAP